MELSDGYYHKMTANQVAEAMFLSIDDEGRHFQILINISDYKYDDNEISIIDGFIKLRSGNNVSKNNTPGWKLQMERKDG